MIAGANFINQTFVQPALKKPEPPPSPLEKLTAPLQQHNRAMETLATKLGISPTGLDRIALPQHALTLFLLPVPNPSEGVTRPSFEQLVQHVIDTNGQLLKDAGVDIEELLAAAREMDKNGRTTGSGTTVTVTVNR